MIHRFVCNEPVFYSVICGGFSVNPYISIGIVSKIYGMDHYCVLRSLLPAIK